MKMLDALVLGKGPAALAAAAELAGRGLAVAVAGPAGPVHWPARYGAWADEMEATGHADCIARAWPSAAVDCGEGRRHALGRAYASIDNGALAGKLVDRCDTAGVRWMDGEAVAATHRADGTTVALRDGREIRARLVVDATGHRAALVRRADSPPPAFQAAVGWMIDAPDVDLPWDAMVLMDWRDGHLPPGEDRAVPTFLYAGRLPGGLVFAEETSLAARPAVPFELLERRLKLRLAALGAPDAKPVSVERVWIPMGGALPEGTQRAVGFGAAAGMVHPATGYSVARSLRAAPVLADAVAGALGREDVDPETAARTAWRALWPGDARRREALYRFGLEVLLTLDTEQTQAFFDAFCRLATDEWRGFLDATLTSRELAGSMGRFFSIVRPDLRARLAREAMGPAGAGLAAGIIQALRP
ncbi:MAG: lycopene cyclase family protein [Gemmatimonadetes bacterium]|nr:lycopene cyclase family protein [Gemmatimonadota bacterium]